MMPSKDPLGQKLPQQVLVVGRRRGLAALGSQGFRNRLGVEALFRCELFRAVDVADQGDIRVAESRCKLVLKKVRDGGVAARLEGRRDTVAREMRTQGVKRVRNGRRMVAEVLNCHEVGPVDQHLLTAMHALKMFERRDQTFERQSVKLVAADRERRREDRHRGVTHVEKAVDREFYGQFAPAPAEFEARPLGPVAKVQDAQVAPLGRSHAQRPRPRHRQERLHARLVAVQEHPAIARHDARHVAKRAQNVLKVAENIRVVHLDIVDYENLRLIVDEFTALVEKGAVVLVALDDERSRCAAKMRARRQIARHAAHEPARIAVCNLQQIRRHGRRRRLAVRARDDDVAPLRQNEPVEQLRHGRKRQLALVKQPLDLRVPARIRVAHHDEIRRELREPLGRVTLKDIDTRILEHRGHRRINTRVGAENLVPALAHQKRRVTHRRAANPHKVDFHNMMQCMMNADAARVHPMLHGQ